VSGFGEADGRESFASMSHDVLEDLQGRIGMDAWLVSRRDGNDQVILCAVDDVFGFRTGSLHPWADSFCAQMIDAQAPMVAPAVAAVPAYAAVRARNGLAVESYLTVPILAPDGEQLGSLCALGHRERPDLADCLRTVRLQATLLGALLSHELRHAHQIRHIERTETDTHRDPLTGVPDRRAWETALRAEEGRAARYATSTAVIIVNLDDLKDINTVLGHQGGDEYLLRAAAVLTKRLRAVDLLARLGGDDFGIILPGTEASQARAVAADLTRLMRESNIHVAVGVGQRRNDTGMVGAWRSADVAMRADKVQAAQRRIEDHEVSPRAPDAGPAAPHDLEPPGLSNVDALLQLAKDQLGMDATFLSTFEGTQQRFRNIVSSVDLPIAPGYVGPREGSYCQMIVDGELDEVIPDTAADPRARALAVTRALGIGSYVGVPVHRRNGSLYGTLCAFSLHADETLSERGAKVLKAIAGVMMDLAEIEDQSNHRRHEVLQRLNTLYADNGPRIVYQPVQTLSRLETVGFEALSRFPEGSANPDEWFRSASKAGVGTTLELTALQNALIVLPQISGFLALNTSSALLTSPGFKRLIDQMPLHRIVLEVTEHEPIDDYQNLLAVLKPLRARGLRVAVDDAGAGFASMRHILTLVPDLIKLDISLVRGIDTDRPRQALAAALAAFAFKTGALVIAEGIETAEELDCLRALNIDYGQGYHLARPAPITFHPAPR
jgi:diguanylate cyclase (GGDEF)-like protein